MVVGQAAWEEELDARFEREYSDDANLRRGERDNESVPFHNDDGREMHGAIDTKLASSGPMSGWESELDRSAQHLNTGAQRSDNSARQTTPVRAQWEFEIDESVAREAQERLQRHLLRSRERELRACEEGTVVVQPDWREWGEEEKTIIIQAARSLREAGVAVSCDTYLGAIPAPSPVVARRERPVATSSTTSTVDDDRCSVGADARVVANGLEIARDKDTVMADTHTRPAAHTHGDTSPARSESGDPDGTPEEQLEDAAVNDAKDGLAPSSADDTVQVGSKEDACVAQPGSATTTARGGDDSHSGGGGGGCCTIQ